MAAEQSQMLGDYAELRQRINVRAGRGPDATAYITPDDPAVAAKVKEVAGDYSEDRKEQWGDYERLNRWVTMNIEYIIDSYTPILPERPGGPVEWEQGFWKLPFETLRDVSGDCEDMSALLASMILNYNERRFPVWVVGIATPEPEPKGHVAIVFPVVNKRITIIDNSGRYQSIWPIGWGLNAYDPAEAMDKWLSHWEEKMPGAYVYMAVSEDVYARFSSTEEFIDWVYEYFEY